MSCSNFYAPIKAQLRVQRAQTLFQFQTHPRTTTETVAILLHIKEPIICVFRAAISTRPQAKEKMAAVLVPSTSARSHEEWSGFLRC